MNIEKIKYLYDVTDEIAYKYEQYLNCDNYDVSLSPYVDILSKDFSSPITHYIKYHDNANYENIIQDAKSYNNRLLNCKTFNENKIALEYIKNKTNCNMVIVHETSIETLVSYLNQIGVVSITKKINLDHNGTMNLLCDIYMQKLLKYNKYEQRYQFLTNKMSYIDNNDIYCIILELDEYNINEIKNNINEHVGEQKVHIISNYNMVVTLCSSLFHHESLIFLEQRVLRNWLSEEFTKTFVKLNAIKKWLYTDVSMLDRESFMILDEGTMATLGIRNAHKFKCIMLLGEIDTDKVQNAKTRIPFLKVNRPHDTGNEEMNFEWNDNLIYNNSYFYYSNGVKILNIHDAFDIKITRYNLVDYFDFIAMTRIHEMDRIVVIDSERINATNHTKNELISRFTKYDRIVLQSLDKEII